MSPAYRLTPRAYADLRAIARYTLQTWGSTQRRRYLRALEKQFETLANQPGLGRRRPEIGPGFCSYPCGRHIVFYLAREGGIDIIGVPHQGMDVAGHMAED